MFVCGFLLMAAVFVVSASNICPDGYGYWYRNGSQVGHGQFKPSCYKFVREDFSWGQARKNCIALGGDLVTIETGGENSHLIRQIKSFPLLQRPELTDYIDWGYWTGGNDQLRGKDWRWAAFNSKMVYKAWLGGQPDNRDASGRRENCLHLWRLKGWGWNDLCCENEYQGSICEITARF